MRRLLTWVALLLAMVLLARPVAAQLPQCGPTENPFPQAGGANIRVFVNGLVVSNHSALNAALGRMLLLQVAWPDSTVEVEQVARYRMSCFPRGFLVPPPPAPPPPPPPPPPGPVEPWVLTVASIELVASDTTRAVVTVRLARRDGSPVAGATTGWTFTNSTGTTTTTRTTDASGSAARGWVGAPGVNTVEVVADSAAPLTLTRTIVGISDALRVDGFLLVPESPTVVVGQSIDFCGLIVFGDGKVAMRTADASATCASEYAKIPPALRAVTAAQRARADSVSLCVVSAGGGAFGPSAYCAAPTDMEGVRLARLARPRWMGPG